MEKEIQDILKKKAKMLSVIMDVIPIILIMAGTVIKKRKFPLTFYDSPQK